MVQPEIIVAIIAAFAAIFPVILAYYERKKNKISQKIITDLNEQINERELHSNVIEKLHDLSVLGDIYENTKDLFSKTNLDRFLILVAFNGYKSYDYVSVIYEQYRVGNHYANAIARYKKLRIDTEYNNMLVKAERYGRDELEVSKMNDCMLKNIYTAEGVKYSDIVHLFRYSLDEKRDVMIYISVATHKDVPLTSSERTDVNIMLDSVVRPHMTRLIETFGVNQSILII